ncbi:hypothetical protein [Paeniglutamicibacter sp.]|uniref:DUF7793 family protein n=1 Tax=Paeniglutamicibacter sp. TaxID=1934391 RepID=UPI003988D09F
MTILGDSTDTLEPATASEVVAPGAAQLLWKSTQPHVQIRYFDDDLLEVSFTPGTVLTISMVQDILNALTSRLETKTGHLLANISGLSNVDTDVARVFSKFSRNVRVALLGSGPADQVLARFFMRNLHPEHLCAYVEGREEAIAFLYKP